MKNTAIQGLKTEALQTIKNSFNIKFRIGSKDFDCFFGYYGPYGAYTPEAELALSLLPAMQLNASIDMKGKQLDALFLNSITDIQAIYHHWDSTNSITQVLNTDSQKMSAPIGSKNGRIGVFFSGGVDSFFTLLKHKAEITDIIFVHGLDIPLENTQLRNQTVQAIKKVAEAFNVRLLEVESDLKAQILPYGEWGRFTHGVALASIALTLQDEIDAVLIPGSHEYANLFPLGTHPMLDHLWSTENLRFIHDGAEATRLEKVLMVAKSDIALKHLRVCWKNPGGSYNCGKCEKCLRTMISLYAAGKLDQCPTFDVPLDFARVARMKLKGENKRRFAIESLELLIKTKGSKDLQKAIKTALRTSRFKGLFKKSYK